MGIKDRLLLFISFKKMKNAEFERQANLSNGYINNFKGNVGNKKLEDIFRGFPELSRVWLLTGEGEMLNTVPATSPAAPSSDKDRQQLLDVIASQQRTIEVQANLLSQFAQRESVSVPPAAPAASAAAAGQ